MSGVLWGVQQFKFGHWSTLIVTTRKERAEVVLAKLALKDGGQYRIVKEE